MTENDPKDSVHDEQFGNSENTNKEINSENTMEDSEDMNLSNEVKDSDEQPSSEPEKYKEKTDAIEAKPAVEAEVKPDNIDAGEASDDSSIEKDKAETSQKEELGSIVQEEIVPETDEKIAEPTGEAAEDVNPTNEVENSIEQPSSEHDISKEENDKAVPVVEAEVKPDNIDASEVPIDSSVEKDNADTAQKEELGSIVQEEVIPKNDEKIAEPTGDVAEVEVNSEIKIEDKPKETQKTPELVIPNDIDFATKTKEELLDLIKEYLNQFPIEKIKRQIEAIKSNFYKLHNSEIEEKKTNFTNEGGKEEDFKVEESPLEITMKELLNDYRQKRNQYNQKQEGAKETNLAAKYEIINTIKELVNSQESLNKTFHDFRNLQEKWREIGPVPQSKVKDLWEKYHYHVEAFYDYIKINKELRDLDFKKNLEAKLKLCENAEELLIEPSVVEAFKQLQVLHEQWREIGPVPAEKRTDLWERFKDSTSKINHKHQEYFVNLKDEQKKNLQEKTLLCEKAEELSGQEPQNAKEWETKSKELIELQKIWKTIGFAPKKYNTSIYERFRSACDTFFNKKRDFFAQNREEQDNNLQLKTELCIQAEGLSDSTDWKKTTDELIKLQKSWKTIGPVPIKNSDKIWKRFRAACDKFFNNKSHYYANIDSTYQENLKLKEELLKEIEDFTPSKEVSENLEKLKDFQRKWGEIGFVPIKQKDAIQEKYRAVINAKFDELQLDDDRKSLLKFRNKIEGVSSKPNSNKRLDMERDKCYNKLKQLESDIALWENNIGFFSNSKNAESMIADIERKIEQAKERMQSLQEKLNILDDFDG